MKAYLQPPYLGIGGESLGSFFPLLTTACPFVRKNGIIAFRYILDEPLKNAASDVVLLGMGSQMLKLFFQEGHAAITNNTPK